MQLILGVTDKRNRGSYMSAHVLLNLLNELRKRDKMRGLPSILSLYAMSLRNSIIQEHECYILLSYDIKITLLISAVKTL